MAGGQPFTVQSPTQSGRFVPYSPTSKPHNYSYEPYQPPPQTPPSFTTSTLARSPSFGHPAANSSPPSAMNGNGHPHSDAPAQYPLNSSSPIQQHSRTILNSMTGSNRPPYANVPPSHAHPSRRQGSLVLSPKHEYAAAMNDQRLDMASLRETPNIGQSVRPSSQKVVTVPCQRQMH